MIFAYKINADRDGFTPQRLHERMDSRRRVHLGWRQYVDAVEEGDLVLVFFSGRGLASGIYCQALVTEVDSAARRVWLSVESIDVDVPLSDGSLTRRVALQVAQSKRQVFALPEDAPTACSAFEPGAASCANRQCDSCAMWGGLPRVLPENAGRPDRLGLAVTELSAGFWTVPPRSFLVNQPSTVVAESKLATALLRTFKSGEAGLAYTFAAAVHEALQASPEQRFDALVPIPLSPEKAEAQELHRARALAVQLSFLLKTPVREALSLAVPVGKRAMLKQQKKVQQFEAAYQDALRVDPRVLSRCKTVLLVDDVCTRGSTLTVAADALLATYPNLRVSAAVGAQMAVRASASGARNLLQDDPGERAPNASRGALSSSQGAARSGGTALNRGQGQCIYPGCVCTRSDCRTCVRT
jgi:hypothetical protein